MKATVQHNIKVLCHTCDGAGFTDERAYPNGEKVKITCPECNGNKYVVFLSLPEETELKLPLIDDKKETLIVFLNSKFNELQEKGLTTWKKSLREYVIDWVKEWESSVSISTKQEKTE